MDMGILLFGIIAGALILVFVINFVIAIFSAMVTALLRLSFVLAIVGVAMFVGSALLHLVF